MSNGHGLPRRVFNAACGGEREVVIAWLDTGGHINALCSWEEEDAIRCAVLLQAAAGLGRLELVRELLQRGAITEVSNSAGRQPLMLAACLGHTAILLLLLQHSADPDLQSADRQAACNGVEQRYNGNGFTALMHAASHGHEACVQVLLRAGANTELRNKLGETASQLAKAKEHHVLAETIEQHARSTEAGRQAAAQLAAHFSAQAAARAVQEALEARANTAMKKLLAQEGVEQHRQSAPSALPQLAPCGSSGRAWRLWAAW